MSQQTPSSAAVRVGPRKSKNASSVASLLVDVFLDLHVFIMSRRQAGPPTVTLQ